MGEGEGGFEELLISETQREGELETFEQLCNPLNSEFCARGKLRERLDMSRLFYPFFLTLKLKRWERLTRFYLFQTALLHLFILLVLATLRIKVA